MAQGQLSSKRESEHNLMEYWVAEHTRHGPRSPPEEGHEEVLDVLQATFSLTHFSNLSMDIPHPGGRAVPRQGSVVGSEE